MKEIKKRWIRVSILIVLLCSLASITAGITGTWALQDNEWYQINESITLNLSRMIDMPASLTEATNMTILVRNKNASFKISSSDGVISFIPNDSGLYHISDIYGNSLHELTVHPKILEKSSYTLNESIILNLSGLPDSRAIAVIAPGEEYQFRKIDEDLFSFVPRMVGLHDFFITANLTTMHIAAKVLAQEDQVRSGIIIGLRTEQSGYLFGEIVSITIQNAAENTADENMYLIIQSNNTFFHYLGTPSGTIQFRPPKPGMYTAELQKEGVVLASASFSVREMAQEEIVFDKESYILGEFVSITAIGNISSLMISWEGDAYTILNPNSTNAFFPGKAGRYLVTGAFSERSRTATFMVAEKDSQVFGPDEEAVILIDLSPYLRNESSLIAALLGFPLIEEVSAYIEGYEQDRRFKLAIEQVDTKRFRIHILRDRSIPPSSYWLFVKARINGRNYVIREPFAWRQKMLPEKKHEDIVDHSFRISEDAVFEFDFTQEIAAERNALEYVQKTTVVESISAYVEGMEKSNKVNIEITHKGLDRFGIVVRNKDIPRDVYKIIVIAKLKEQYYTRQQLFNWGLEERAEIIDKIQQKNITTPKEQIIEVTGINATGQHEDQQNESDQISESIEALIVSSDQQTYPTGGTAILSSNKDILFFMVIANGSRNVVAAKDGKAGYYLKNHGRYIIKAEFQGQTASALMDVVPSEEFADLHPPIAVVGRDEKVQDFRIISEKRPAAAETKSKKVLTTQKKISQNKAKEYDVLIEPNDLPPEKIQINGLKIYANRTARVKIESVEAEQITAKNPVYNAFAIDLSELEFEAAKTTIIAKGASLIKCADWNFAQGICQGSWKKIMDLTPGKEYAISLSKEDPAFAEIGLITINSDKSIYKEDETAYLSIGILDNEGHTIFDAVISLLIMDPKNGTVNLSTETGAIRRSQNCGGFDPSSSPDYMAEYQVTNQGAYTMIVSAVTYDGNPMMQDTFIVEQKPGFDVTRKAPTRIFPPVPYEVNITLAARTRFEGAVREKVPAEFTITPQNEMRIQEMNGYKILEWQVTLLPGVTSKIGYEFKAPDRSPDIFYLGSLSIGNWSEARRWQIASDAQHLDSVAMSTAPANGNITISVSNIFTITCTPACTGGGGVPTVQEKYQYTTTAACAAGNTNIPESGAVLTAVTNPESGANCEATSETITASQAGIVYISCFATKSTRTRRSPQCYTVTVNPDPLPSWSDNRTNDTLVYQGDLVNFTVEWNDNSNLSRFIFSTNASGAWQNATPVAFSRTPQNSSNISQINQTPGTDIGWQFFANDTLNGKNQTGIFAFSVLGVRWNDSSAMSFGSLDAGGAAVYKRSILAHGSNTNAVVSCSGSCSAFADNWTDSTTMNGNRLDIGISCSENAKGAYAATYSLQSDEDRISDNISVICTIQDSIPPSVYLESPENNSVWGSSLNVDFSFNVSESGGVTNCSLIIGDAFNKTNTTHIEKNTPNQTITQAVGIGDYIWRINCTDFSGNVGTSGVNNISIMQDFGAPGITITNPGNGSYTNKDPVNLNATTNENALCKYSTNSTFNYTEAGELFQSTGELQHEAVLGSLAQGRYAYYVKCRDTFSNVNNNINQGFTIFTVDKASPNITLVSPANNSTVSKSYVNFSWYGIDLYASSILSCNLSLNGIDNASSITSANNTAENYSVYIANGTYSWSVKCIDDAGNENVSVTHILRVDGQSPSVSASSPSASPSVGTSGTAILLSANVSDDMSGIKAVEVNVTARTSGSSYKYSMVSQGNGLYEYNFSDTSETGYYDYYITAYDNAFPESNSLATASKSFEIAGINAIISIQAANITYGQDKKVNLTTYGSTDIADREGGVINLTGISRNDTQRTCTMSFGAACANGAQDDTIDACNAGTNGNRRVREIYLNATRIQLGEVLRATCEFDPQNNKDEVEIWYYDGTDYTQVQSGSAPDGSIFNQTASIIVTGANGQQWIRCIINQVGESASCPAAGGRDVDDANFTVVAYLDEEGTSPAVTYSEFGNNYTKVSDIEVIITIANFTGSGSSAASNNDPDLQVKLYDGSGYNYGYSCGADSITSNGNVNCSRKVNNATVMRAWNISSNRMIQIRGINFDEEKGRIDFINYTDVHIVIQTPSKAENYGSLGLSALLLLQVQYLSGETWTTAKVVSNASRSIAVNETFDIANLWETSGAFNTENSPLGNYRVQSSLTDSQGAVLSEDNGQPITDAFSFAIAYLKIHPQNPKNNSIRDAAGFWANLTLNTSYHTSGGWCGYSIDGGPNITMQNDSSSHFYNLTNAVSVGGHNLIFYCNDSVGRWTRSDMIVFNAADQTAPAISLEYPANGSIVNERAIRFSFTVYDNIASSLACNLTLDERINASGFTILNGSTQNVTITDLNQGQHSWNVTCSDLAGNTDSSDTVSFNVALPDFSVTADDMMFNDTTPIEGENITINVTVHNIGGSDGKNILVQFFDGIPGAGGIPIGANKSVNISSLSNTSVIAYWPARIGTQDIHVSVDPLSSIAEESETNNNATRNIATSSWHIVYGEEVGSLEVSDPENRAVYSWQIQNASSGNIFVADYESSVIWANLTAIGINKSGHNATNDFAEIDTALNSTLFSDSVNSTFTQNGMPTNLASFIIFRAQVRDVPIVNSTNNSQFVTGILWDASDETIGEYNGSQDILFAASINPQKQGAYGVYDYEIKIPSELKRYKKQDTASVTFYVELK